MVFSVGSDSHVKYPNGQDANYSQQVDKQSFSKPEKTIEELLTELDTTYNKTFTLRLLKWLSGVFASANIFFSYEAKKREIISEHPICIERANNISVMTYNMLGVAGFDHDINHLIKWKNSEIEITPDQKREFARGLINDKRRIEELALNIKNGNADVVALQEVTHEMWCSLKDHLPEYSFVIRTPNDTKALHGVGLLVKKEIAACVVTNQIANLKFKTHRMNGLVEVNRNVALVTLDFIKRKWTVLSAHVPQIQGTEDKTLNEKGSDFNIKQISKHFSSMAAKVTKSTSQIFVAAADFNQRMHTDQSAKVLERHNFKNFISPKVTEELQNPNPSSELGIDHILVMASRNEQLKGESSRIEQQTTPSDHHAHVAKLQF
jgi:exonuclease III